MEAEEGSGKTIAFILPIVLKLRRDKAGIKALVLTSSLEDSRKIFYAFRKFTGRGKRPFIFAFGTLEDKRKENRVLLNRPDVVIGTPKQVIDHIRRGNLAFSHLQTVVIDVPEKIAQSGFNKDFQFISAKFPHRKQTILFAPSLNGGVQDLISGQRRPVLLPASAWRNSMPEPVALFIPVTERQKPHILLRLILAQEMESLLVLCSSRLSIKRLEKILREGGIEFLHLTENLSEPRRKRILTSFNQGYCPVLLSTVQAVEMRRFRWISHVIYYDLPQDMEHLKPGSLARNFVLRKAIYLGREEQYTYLQEKSKMKINKEQIPGDEQVIVGSIRRILKKIKEEEDPVQLNRFRKLMRKNVPLWLRSYFAAYLFKQALQPDLAQDEHFARLFVSVGKNRGVYPQDLIKLFITKLNVNRSQVGDVKILDNYSFIGIRANQAERAIKALSGTEFKGRRIMVNFARRRGER